MISMLTRALDWQKYLLRVLPIAFRSKASHIDITNLLSTGLRSLNDALVVFRLYLLLEYQGSGQRLVLERILRVRCAGGASLINVVNVGTAKERYDLYPRARSAEAVYGYPREDLEPIGAGINGYIYSRPEEYDDDQTDFRVEVNTALWDAMSMPERLLLRRLVDRFKLYGTKYTIIQI